ncbi:hypothetical protein TREES_T100003206 [Tupaia chinensis]|uniref:Uncharacterized protein n=1 Tax=Tupaia chinensis TaxID=246437 RepID=L9KFJ9_TUPCH|nr:hypothetical protein TREES_T100003206 [Tupaia chinensis]
MASSTTSRDEICHLLGRIRTTQPVTRGENGGRKCDRQTSEGCYQESESFSASLAGRFYGFVNNVKGRNLSPSWAYPDYSTGPRHVLRNRSETSRKKEPQAPGADFLLNLQQRKRRDSGVCKCMGVNSNPCTSTDVLILAHIVYQM